MYLLVPDAELSNRAGKEEIATAVQYLVDETHAQQRKVSHRVFKAGLRDRRSTDEAELTIDGTWHIARDYSISLWSRRVSCHEPFVRQAHVSFPIPGGDLREMKPFLIVNTGLRRLGCGGRAAMGMDSPMCVMISTLLRLVI